MVTKMFCFTCGKEIYRTLRELKKAKKRNQKRFFCNKVCVGDTALRDKRGSFAKGNQECSNRKDEFTPFRYHFGKAKQRSIRYSRDFNIDLEFLKKLWDSQNGKCAVTGIPLTHKFYYDFEPQIKSPYQASLDRIDNSKGYTKNNVRFVCLMFNYARNTFDETEVIQFCKKVANNA